MRRSGTTDNPKKDENLRNILPIKAKDSIENGLHDGGEKKRENNFNNAHGTK